MLAAHSPLTRLNRDEAECLYGLHGVFNIVSIHIELHMRHDFGLFYLDLTAVLDHGNSYGESDLLSLNRCITNEKSLRFR